MYTKPCLRSADGCQGLVKDSRPGRLAARKFCSSWCSNRYRVDRGMHPLQRKNPAQRRFAGRRGGKAGAEKRRKLAVLAVAERVRSMMPQMLCEKLTDREQALLQLLFVKAWESGHRAGMVCERVRHGRAEAFKAQGLKAPRRGSRAHRSFLEQARKAAAA